MSNDRELLELAAKAGGHPIRYGLKCGPEIMTIEGYWYSWSPKTDGVHAINLLAAIGDKISGNALLQIGDAISTRCPEKICEAIVRAAAAIGKGGENGN